MPGGFYFVGSRDFRRLYLRRVDSLLFVWQVREGTIEEYRVIANGIAASPDLARAGSRVWMGALSPDPIPWPEA